MGRTMAGGSRAAASLPLLLLAVVVCGVAIVNLVSEEGGTGAAVREELVAPATKPVARDHSKEKGKGKLINTARDVLTKQKKKILQLRSDVKKMTAELVQTKRKTKALKAKAKQRKHQLHVAHARYKRLSQKIAVLDKKAKKRAPKVSVHVPRGSSAVQADKAVRKLTR